MSTWTWLWIGWIAAFVVIEAAAVFNDKKEDTLSEHLRRWFSVNTRPGRTVFLIMFGAFVAWFGLHILTGMV